MEPLRRPARVFASFVFALASACAPPPAGDDLSIDQQAAVVDRPTRTDNADTFPRSGTMAYSHYGGEVALGDEFAAVAPLRVGERPVDVNIYAIGPDGQWTSSARIVLPESCTWSTGSQLAVVGRRLATLCGDSVRVYEYGDQNGWELAARLSPFSPDGPEDQIYAGGLAMTENRLAVSFAFRDPVGERSGLFVYERGGDDWQLNHDLRLDVWAHHVALARGAVAVGSYGTVVVHEFSDEGLREAARFEAADPYYELSDLELDGDKVAAAYAAWTDTIPVFRAGGVELYERNEDGGWSRLEHLRTAGRPSQYGPSVALEGDQLIAGSQGVVESFERVGSKWSVNATLFSPAGGGESDDNLPFGWTVARRGATLVATSPSWSARNLEAGAVFVYRADSRADEAWRLDQELGPQVPLPSESGWFGSVVAIDELSPAWLAIGAPEAPRLFEAEGLVYVYEHRDGDWRERRRLENPMPAVSDRFGAAVGLDGGTLLVGAPGRAPVAGSVHLFEFERAVDDWTYAGQLRPPTSQQGASFGAALAIDGDRAVVGAPGYRVGDGRTGAVFVYERSDGGWRLASQILAPLSTVGFGEGVALSGATVAVWDGFDVLVYEPNPEGWRRTSGSAISAGTFALSGDRVAVARVDLLAADTATVQVYRRGDQGAWPLESEMTVAGRFYRDGASIGLRGGALVVGLVPGPARPGEPALAESVFAFRRQQGDWTLSSGFPVDGRRSGEWGGLAVAASRFLIGRPYDGGGNARGDVYEFDLQAGDADDDGATDDIDADDDGDGVPDDEDSAPFDSWRCADTDADGCDDCSRSGPGAAPRPGDDGDDLDEDGVCDLGDRDDDGDAIEDEADNCPRQSNPGQGDADEDGLGDVCDGDLDGDLVADAGDNCPSVPNPSQSDTDGDRTGDACDDDDDGDGIEDGRDVCPLHPDPDQADIDRDGRGDRCDEDDDDDGVLDGEDNCATTVNASQQDIDRDGHGDACDPDIDGDDVANDRDNCPRRYNPDQDDVDRDGSGDQCDDTSAPPQPAPPSRQSGGGCSAASTGASSVTSTGRAGSLALLLVLVLAMRRRPGFSWRFGIALACSLIAGACHEPRSAVCGDLLCPPGLSCVPGLERCVSPGEIAPCEGLQPGSPCRIDGRQGQCRLGACELISCGNGVLEPGETCDDGNRRAADGCSADCQSDELCGNGILDVFTGEQCDCGLDPTVVPDGCGAPNGPGTGCSLDCRVPGCGDGIVSDVEDCEGGPETTCEELGFPGGTLSCGIGCRFDTSLCFQCGNGEVEPTETCDGAPPAADCVARGFDLGHLGCTASCLDDERDCRSFEWSGVTGTVRGAGAALWSQADEAIAVGRAGFVYEYRADVGGAMADVPLRADLYAVDGSGELVVAVGAGGTVLERRRGEWSEVASSTDRDLLAVRVFANGTAVAVGDDSVAVERVGDGAWRPAPWRPSVRIPPNSFTSVDGASVTALAVGGSDGQIWIVEGAAAERAALDPGNVQAVRAVKWLSEERLIGLWNEDPTRFSTGIALYDGDSWSRRDTYGAAAALVSSGAFVAMPTGLGEIAILDSDDWERGLWRFASFSEQRLGSPTDLAILESGELLLLTDFGLFRLPAERWIPDTRSPLTFGGAQAFFHCPGGTFAARHADYPSRTLLYRRVGAGWQPHDSLPGLANHVAGLDDGPRLAVGDAGLVRWRGDTDWDEEAAGLTDQDLHGAIAFAGARAYAVGGGGTVLLRSAGGWERVEVPTEATLRSVWAASVDDVYVVGDGSTLLHYDGVRWRHVLSESREDDFLGVFGVGAGVIVVGTGGYALHLVGGAWQQHSMPVDGAITALHGLAANDVYAVGPDAGLIHWDGTTWARVASPTSGQSDEGSVVTVDDDAVFVGGAVFARRRFW